MAIFNSKSTENIFVIFQPDEKDQGLSMEQAVENSMNSLLKGDSEEIRRMSEGSQWNRGKSMLKRSETIKALKSRASEYNTRKATMKRSKKLKGPNVDTIEEAPEEGAPENRAHMPIQRTNTYQDPENLDEREV